MSNKIEVLITQADKLKMERHTLMERVKVIDKELYECDKIINKHKPGKKTKMYRGVKV